ncbi:MAG TPA: transcriptional repressor LexA [Acidimicrobiaceae bacterium]|jgi:repressor LexA|nr:transcriptional repressor LexA [Acidimicrobiaceae bacterium]
MTSSTPSLPERARTSLSHHGGEPEPLTGRQRDVLNFIETTVSERGYPPSVREICTAVGLASPSTVHSHLKSLQRMGYLRRDATKPRAIEVRFDPNSGATGDRAAVKHVPLVGDVAAGTGVIATENVEELMPLPAAFTGDGELFMLRVRGESMINAGIHSGDYVVVRRQPTAQNGEIVVIGIPGEEATVKTFSKDGNKITLTAANPEFDPMVFGADEVDLFGKVVTVLRAL